MVKLLIQFGAGVSAEVQGGPQLTVVDMFGMIHTFWAATISAFSLAKDRATGMLELLADRPANSMIIVDTPRTYIHQLRLEITKPLRLAISEIIVVTFMRAGHHAPPVGIISSSTLSFCIFLDFA
jgi:hypothetical protein